MGSVVHFESESEKSSLDGMPAIGDRIGIYHLTGTIAVGARSIVYDAAHLGLGFRMPVAVKVLRTGSARSLFHLKSSVRNVGRFGGPHVVRIFDVGSLPSGQPYVVMDRLVGDNLRRHLAMHGPLPPVLAAEVIVQLCAGLAMPHRNSVVHGSLQPSRIIVRPRPDGTLRAALVGLESGGEASPGYASPEQLGKKPIDASTDVWALGLILYEMITGAPAYAATDLAAMRLAMFEGPVPEMKSPHGPVPAVLQEVVRRAITMHRGGRYPTVDKLAFALAPFASERRSSAPPPRPVLAATVVSTRPLTDLAATVVREIPRLHEEVDDDDGPTTQRDDCAFGSARTALSEREPFVRAETHEATKVSPISSVPSSLPELGRTVVLPPPPPALPLTPRAAVRPSPLVMASMAVTMPPSPRLEPFPSVPPRYERYELLPATLSPEVLPRRRWGWLIALPLVAATLIAAVAAARPALRRGPTLASWSVASPV